MLNPFNGRLAAYGKILRGDENTSEDQVASAYSPEDARRIAACWNACQGIPLDDLERAELGEPPAAELQRLTAHPKMVEALQLGLDAMNTLDYRATPANREFVVAAREALRCAGEEPRA